MGKEKRARLEPRILVEDPEKSYHAAKRVSNDDIFDNLLIHGDNLLALKALEQEYAGKVKCIYIDPPYNTGNAFEHYDDGLEHSIWLSLMRERLEILRKLLCNGGLIFIQIDNKELHYLKVLCDEVFGRANYRNSIIAKKGIKSVQKQFDVVDRLNAGYDTILVYSKTSELKIPNLVIKAETKELKGSWNNHWRGTDRPTMRYELFGIIPSKGQWRWEKNRSMRAVKNFEIFTTYMKSHNLSLAIQDEIDIGYASYCKEFHITDKRNFELLRLSKNNKPEHYIPPSDEVLLSENWMDLPVAGRSTDFEHEKNESLIERILYWVTNPGDLVLDSFLGSGTTAAVAHKMGRRWIGIELGDHCDTHCAPRLKKVIDGEDQGGITKSANWKGGGGFRYYNLAPSLIKFDEWGNPIINKQFDENMLVQALCKVEGFVFNPSPDVYWQQGKSTESDFIYITTQHLTAQMLQKLSEDVGADRTLLICCGSFDAKKDSYENLTIKKIPKAILKKCEWNHDDYSLEINNLPMADPTLPPPSTPAKKSFKKQKDPAQLDLFGE